MKRFAAVGIVCFLVVSLSGCGDSADSLMKEQIQYLNDMADAAEKDDQAKAEGIQKKMEENFKKLEALKVSEEDRKKLEQKYKGDLEKAEQRMMQAAMKNLGNRLGNLKMPDFNNK